MTLFTGGGAGLLFRCCFLPQYLMIHIEMMKIGNENIKNITSTIAMIAAFGNDLLSLSEDVLIENSGVNDPYTSPLLVPLQMLDDE